MGFKLYRKKRKTVMGHQCSHHINGNEISGNEISGKYGNEISDNAFNVVLGSIHQPIKYSTSINHEE